MIQNEPMENIHKNCKWYNENNDECYNFLILAFNVSRHDRCIREILQLDHVVIVIDRKVEISEGLLEDIRHELVSLNGFHAFDMCMEETEKEVILNKDDLICLDYSNLIKKIDKVL